MNTSRPNLSGPASQAGEWIVNPKVLMPNKKNAKRAPNVMAGAAPKQRNRQNNRRRSRMPNDNCTSLVGANQSVKRVNNPTGGGGVMSGKELISRFTVSSATLPGTLVLDQVITPTFGRLKALATAWNRIRYRKMKFGINATASSLVGGSYVAAFIADPTDRPPMKEADAWVMAHAGSVQSSWWVSTSIIGPSPPGMLYTSFDQSEPRLSTPGRLVIACVNAPTGDASVSVDWDWVVSFAEPSLEQLETELVFTLEKDARLPLSNGSAGQAFVKYLCKGPGFGDAETADPPPSALRTTDFTPTLPIGVFLKLQSPLTLNSDTGATGAPETAVVTHLGANDAGFIGFYYTTDDVSFTELKTTKPFSIRPMGCPILQEGTLFEEDVLNGSGNVMGAASSRSRRSLTSAPQLKKSSKGKLLSMTGSERS